MKKHVKMPFKTFASIEDMKKDYEEEVLAMKPDERVAAVEVLRRRYFKIRNIPLDIKVKRVVKLVDVSKW